MATTLSRLALYELVWSKPRTQLAKDLGISDVAIGKHCAKLNVPAPPPGYWARLNAGRGVKRTELPIRLPGQAHAVEVGRADHRQWFDRARSTEPLVAPSFTEDIELQVQAALKLIGRVTATKNLDSPDPALTRLITSEARLREEGKTWSYKKPLFESPLHQRQLRIFNSLARALGAICGRQEVRGSEEWIRGVGQVSQLRLHLDFGGVWMDLRFLEPDDNKRISGWRAVKATTLQAGGDYSLVGIQDWCDSAEGKLESQLTVIVSALLRRAELSLRAAAEDHYKRLLQIRQEEHAKEVAQAKAAEAKRVAALRAAEAKIRGEIIDIAKRRSIAADIRSTIEALHAHPEVHGTDSQRFQRWSRHALEVADSIDPLKATMTEVLGSFELQD